MTKKDKTLVRLGANLREARENRGLSQEDLASIADVHRTYVGGIERGEYNITIRTLLKFTTALGISLNDATRGLE